jgi:two-component system NtrC family sensor kinase
MRNTPDDTDEHTALEAITRAGKRAAAVVHRLLATARPGAVTAPPEPINVIEGIEETAALVKSYLDREGIRLTARMPSDPLPPVLAVPGELDDVWLNLIINAHDALKGREKPEIGVEVRLMPPDDAIEVVVWDNGAGIPENVIGDIFKPFFTTKPSGEGTGLGLHICSQVIDRVGGSISVRSLPNRGTTFTVRLPVLRSGAT